jgi:DinB superfamily
MAMSDQSATLRKQLADAMSGRQAHVDFDAAVKDFPVESRGVKAAHAPHTAWQLLEHMRIAQHDILDFSRNPNYRELKWPDEYWPNTDAPPDPTAWDRSVASFRQEAQELVKLISDTKQDLFQPFAHGDGQTLLREALLIANHNSYHLGQLVYLKKMLIAQS